ncbi:MAG: NUDIX hydrolase [Ktedonobacterales bacterium]
MAIKKWTTKERRVVFEHPRVTLVEDTVNLPNGTTMPYLRIAPSNTDSVGVIAINENGELLILQEYSYPPDEIMWQLPGGGMEPGEDIVTAANRELGEESGYTAKNCKVIGAFHTSNRLTNQKQYVVVCTDLKECKAHADQGEFIENHWLSKAEIDRKITAGEVTNINLLAALNIWEHAEI